jgi:hypothetical protein
VNRLLAGRSSIRIPARVRDFSFLQFVHTDSGARPACYSMGSGFSLSRRWSVQGVKLTTHIHPAPKLRTSGATALLPHTPSWRRQKIFFGFKSYAEAVAQFYHTGSTPWVTLCLVKGKILIRMYCTYLVLAINSIYNALYVSCASH